MIYNYRTENEALTLCQMWFLYRRPLTPSRSTGPWRRYRTWERHTHEGLMWTRATESVANGSNPLKADVLFALAVPFAAWQRDFDDAGGEGHEQRVTPAVDLHADDAFVLHAVNAAPEHVKHTQSQKSLLDIHFARKYCDYLLNLLSISKWKVIPTAKFLQCDSHSVYMENFCVWHL